MKYYLMIRQTDTPGEYTGIIDANQNNKSTATPFNNKVYDTTQIGIMFNDAVQDFLIKKNKGDELIFPNIMPPIVKP